MKGQHLTAKQERFCYEYAASGNAYQAAKAAGYSERYALSNTHRLVGNPLIKERLAELYRTREEELIADGTELKKRLTEIVRCTAKEENIVIVGTGDGRSEPMSVEKLPSFRDQMKAIELLARMGGMFNDKMSVEANVPVVIMGYDDIPD